MLNMKPSAMAATMIARLGHDKAHDFAIHAWHEAIGAQAVAAHENDHERAEAMRDEKRFWYLVAARIERAIQAAA